ncbi:beta-N-acetylhexosaminidase [Chitinimonas sp. BJB300]|uniref:beta-N-acetylhexosaminidase n=1 Tax=Chitinimonas sp. BJB300 TaxID=1559339 RepID=UPI000C119B2F|nr:beta-N-acetylhexosaminidase [Chitinimonas sp. BJB300]PHV12251.1 beta-N-acetylhexosaminidase [Chitinimonas sp. BJB300]TSJ84763.1 beta-N-acetylhexosaminidase [Chitinimonas sp. BJB300]
MTQDLNKLAGRALMVDVAGDTLTADEASFLRQHHIRAICLFRRNVSNLETTRKLITDLKATIGNDVLIGMDQEGGAVMRTLFLPQAPSAMALGAVGDETLAYQVGAAVARGLAALGVNWNYAPVLDLNNNPKNPVIAERSFGADPVKAARLAGAWMAGHLGEGVATCVKHFPGHGDTHTDSHLDLPLVNKTRTALEQYELSPFHALLKQTPGLMSAHIIFPAFDSTLPATLSPTILQTLLRDDWGYEGVTITDGMNMKAIRERWGQAKGTVMALAAGADLSLVLQFTEEMAAAKQALIDAVTTGEIHIERLAQADARVSAMAARFSSQQREYSAEQDAADRALFARAWANALTLVGYVCRPDLGSKVRLVLQADAPSDGVSEAGLSARVLIEKLAPLYDLEVVTYQKRSDLDWATLPQDGAFTIVASTTRERYDNEQHTRWQPNLHLALWNPYAAGDLACPALVTYGFADAALNAVVGWLKGELEATGTLPAALGQVHDLAAPVMPIP